MMNWLFKKRIVDLISQTFHTGDDGTTIEEIIQLIGNIALVLAIIDAGCHDGQDKKICQVLSVSLFGQYYNLTVDLM